MVEYRVVRRGVRKFSPFRSIALLLSHLLPLPFQSPTLRVCVGGGEGEKTHILIHVGVSAWWGHDCGQGD